MSLPATQSLAPASLLDRARELARRGCSVLPCCWPDDEGNCACGGGHEGRDVGKAPIGKLVPHGRHDATTDEKKVWQWWATAPNANIGVNLERSGLVFVDPDSPEALAEANKLGTPPTVVRVSKNPGYLYTRPEGCPALSTTRRGTSGKLDVMADGYAVVYGRHREGCDVYLETNDLAPAPTWAVELLQESAAARADRTTVVSGASVQDGLAPVRLSPRGMQRWRGELVERDTEDPDRSGSLWYLGLDLAEAGASEGAIVAALAERDDTLGWRKYSDRRDGDVRYAEIARGAAEWAEMSAAEQAKRRPRTSRMPGLAADQKLSASTTGVLAESKLAFLTAREVAEATPDETDWIAPYVAKGATTEVDGKIKVGKTTFITHLLRKVLDGEPFLGRPTRKTGVIYLTEQGPSSFRAALARAGLLEREDLHVLFWHRTSGVSWPEVVRAASARAARLGYEVLVVDTLGQFSGITGDSENAAGAAQEAMAPLQEAAATDGLAIIVGRHERKSGGDVGDSGRGSSAFAGAVDIVLSIRRGEGNTGPNIRVLRALSRFDETPDQLVIEYVDGEYRTLGSEQDVKTQQARLKIPKALPANEGDAIPVKDIYESTEVARATAQVVLDEYVAAGQVYRAGAGKRGDPFRYWRDPEKLSAIPTVEVLAERNGDATDTVAAPEKLSARTPTLGMAERNLSGQADSRVESGAKPARDSAGQTLRLCIDCGEPTKGEHNERCASCSWKQVKAKGPYSACIDCGADREGGAEGRCPACTKERAARFDREYPA